MRKTILSTLLTIVMVCNNTFSRDTTNYPPIKKNDNYISKSNYNYFSKVLVYPLNVNDDLNILNSGSNHFKFYIYDSDQKLIISFDSSPYCSSIVNISTFEKGKYIVKADNPSESHQFYFYKN